LASWLSAHHVAHVLAQIHAMVVVVMRLQEGGKATKPIVAVPFVFFLVLAPALVPVAMALLLLKTLAELGGVFMVVNRSRSLTEGFHCALGYMYK